MDKLDSDKPPFRVGFVLVDGFALMSYACAVEPLRVANQLSGQMLYDVQHMPLAGARAISSAGAMVGADTFLGEQVNFDLVLVVAGYAPERVNLHRLEHWLRLLAEREVMVGGVSAGPLILVRAGVMEGRRVTAHWDQLHILRSLEANIIVEHTSCVRDRGRLTCAGGSAPASMMRDLIAEHHGGVFANRVAAWFENPLAQSDTLSLNQGVANPYGVSDMNVLKAIQAMHNHVDDPLTLSQLANITGVSVRQIGRLFRQHLNCSPLEYYSSLRLKKAYALLQQSLLPIAEIGEACGFHSPAHFSRLFKRAFDVSPSQFRKNRNLTEP